MEHLANTILDKTLSAGFDNARITVTESEINELNIAHNHVSLMRSDTSHTVSILGIKNNRKVTATISSIENSNIDNALNWMLVDVKASPEDTANDVSEGQTGQFEKGPQTPDLDGIVSSARDLLSFQAAQYPTFMNEESTVAHTLKKNAIVTSKGTQLTSSTGYYSASIVGSGKDEQGISSINIADGHANRLPTYLPTSYGINSMMESGVNSTVTQVIASKFVGDIILTPRALGSLIAWLLERVSYFALLNGTSMYKNSVGELIANNKLNIHLNPNRPSQAAYNVEGFVLEPFALVEHGRLNHLLPSFYGSRKLKLPYMPFEHCWEVEEGSDALENMISNTEKGAVVGRLSMGSPALNGDFSGVIKNSFLIEGGKHTGALTETMITGNVAQMLKDIVEISRESIDFGYAKFPWVRISGLRFS